MPRIWVFVWLEEGSGWRGQVFRASWWRPLKITHTLDVCALGGPYGKDWIIVPERAPLDEKITKMLQKAAIKKDIIRIEAAKKAAKLAMLSKQDSLWKDVPAKPTSLPIAKSIPSKPASFPRAKVSGH